MLRISCPFCGVRDHSEFSYGGDASVEYPALDAPECEWIEAVFQRENPDGVQFETWQHLHGCRMWLVVERDTCTHAIHSVRPAHNGIARVLNNEAAGTDES
ncbi:MAG TPA: sarcosine oxidase subunit delta [Gammaproteobacteria bacterium]|jgi:sarcosine oxidase subunit delta|nr:sarcosine oxidase subunit delta [Acidiferrobacteraceae bacterium]MDP6398693.1 sarcosine oxidase subunit delta [Arenicellales bacterium]HCX87542.1 sarcosine oxidase subunit delta [Gammaproteobacteria bacterium]MDP6551279.1 sarcosine oxidase subunit delta [Arenicellales bacterium]MDP6791415.1 sarcosine oxidase subunit delta [Arenicellales bacterium]|tara:strand:- start:31894 stop:32196 length:303 start_codon:yes stop_codon:yes gene_type:complete